MNAVTLVSGLYEYFLLLNEIEEAVITRYKEKGEPTTRFLKTVSLQYNRIAIQLNTKEEGVSRQLAPEYFRSTFEVMDQSVSMTNLYCEREEAENQMREYVLQHAPTSFPTKTNADTNFLSDETQGYLTIADEIAKQAYLCSSGDDYRPGYFSEIIIEDTQIILKQINHWNSRSIDHKKDYHLRNLEFYIPLTDDELKPSFKDEHLGRMLIQFSDRSSQNNKRCGDWIREKMNEEQLKFLQKR